MAQPEVEGEIVALIAQQIAGEGRQTREMGSVAWRPKRARWHIIWCWKIHLSALSP